MTVEVRVSLFDSYRPKGAFSCPTCGTELLSWQGKDGPCALFVWQEGIKHPVDQLADEEVQTPPDDRYRYILPNKFVIYSHDCSAHNPIEAIGETVGDTWTTTRLQGLSKHS